MDWFEGVYDAVTGNTLNVTRDALNGDLSESVALDVVDAWLKTVVSHPDVHQAYILLQARLNGANKLGYTDKLGYNNSTYKSIINSIMMAASDVSALAADTMEVINHEAQLIQDPNIEGIPIKSDKLTSSRRVDVSESRVIVQSKGNMQYATDNAVPHPREWSLTGFLRSTSKLDYFFLIKPSISLQETFLDAFALSRKPVWFKDDHNKFHKVQITGFDYEHEVRSTTTSRVTIQLKEYNPLEVSDNLRNVSNMTEVASGLKGIFTSINRGTY